MISTHYAEPHILGEQELRRMDLLARLAGDYLERRQAEQTLRTHMAEIGGLNARLQHAMRETHHRVKNNLQIVMSLLSLQSSQIREPAAKAALSQAQARIDALALVHRLLHEVEDQTTVDLKRLLGELARKIFEGASLDGAAIHTNVDCVNIQVPSEIAVPIALFTVEALMNISKFAFPESHGDGSVRVALQRHDRQLALAIEDDGIGYLTAAATPGIGSRLLDVFARQVRGKLCVTSKPDQGTIVELVFADPSPMQ
ncbi:MAG: sensor histidine kinase [Alphaproteobacteria bacterium]|nr:sensor histidine kinase [Alphaproteobacteria bacterium]